MQTGMTEPGRMRLVGRSKGDCGAKQPAQLRNRFSAHTVRPGGARNSRIAGKIEKP